MQLSGRTLLHYSVMEQIGVGGMGVVYKALDTHLDRYVAIKVLPPERVAEPERKQRFVQEAKAASALNHPNIVVVHDITSDGGVDFIVMEYIRGRTLAALIGDGLSAREVLRYAIPITDALTRAHEAGIIHRDLKPSNIMVDETGHVKLLDFGLAKLTEATSQSDATRTLGAETAEGALIGTVAYMSPEQAEAKSLDPRSDQFSLGAVLYEMFTGKRAFAGESTISTLAAILRAEPEPMRNLAQGIPLELERMVGRCLRKKREARYPSVAALREELEGYRAQISSTSSGAGVLLSQARRPLFLVPVLLLVAAMAILGERAYLRYARTRWAATQALPEIARLIDDEKISEAYTLAVNVETYLPNDPLLEKQWPALSRDVTLETTPQGAEIFRKDYATPDAPWQRVGLSPLKNIRMPRTLPRWKIVKNGYTTVEGSFVAQPSAVAATIPIEYRIALDREDQTPSGMVRVQTVNASLQNRSPAGAEIAAAGNPGDYWIDRYEVTNRQFKQFLDAGGYRNRAYWKPPFQNGGAPLSWEEAVVRFRDATGRPGPASWQQSDFPPGEADYPVGGVSWYEAAAYCEYAGKSLPTISHWRRAAGDPTGPLLVPASNFSGKGPAPGGVYRGLGPWGTYDMAGNVKEWCWNEARSGQRYILGGGWDESVYMYIDADAHAPFDRAPDMGFRCVRYLAPGEPGKAADPVSSTGRNYSQEKPCSDELFRVYKSFYAYDKTPLNARIDGVDHTGGYRAERISFDAAYGRERVIAYLIEPPNFKTPLQPVVFFPSSNAITERAVWPAYLNIVESLLKSGRAVIIPEYKGTFERHDDYLTDNPNASALYRDHVIAWAKDMRRAIDYLETRPEIDMTKLVYSGGSMGARMGPLMSALEDRIKVNVWVSGGFRPQKVLPEVDPFNFAPRVTIPTLMLNGRFDFLYPVESAQIPMFQCLGTTKEHKRQVIFESGHEVPRNGRIKEVLDWLDHYLGAPQ